MLLRDLHLALGARGDHAGHYQSLRRGDQGRVKEPARQAVTDDRCAQGGHGPRIRFTVVNTRIALVSGSLRAGSTNTAVLEKARAVAPDGVTTVMYGGMGELPHFNPDDDREGELVHPAVADLRAQLAAADALLLCKPEYAGALPGALKNLLEWTVGDAGTCRKPVAWINASGPAAPTGAADAHESLRKVLGYVAADIVEDARVRIPVTRQDVGPDGTVSDPEIRERIADALTALGQAVGHRGLRVDLSKVATVGDVATRVAEAFSVLPNDPRRSVRRWAARLGISARIPGVQVSLAPRAARPAAAEARAALPVDEAASDVEALLAADGLQARDAVDELLAFTGGHPQRTVLLAHYLYNLLDGPGPPEDLAVAAIDLGLAETRGAHQAIWDGVGRVERIVLLALAGGRPVLLDPLFAEWLRRR